MITSTEREQLARDIEKYEGRTVFFCYNCKDGLCDQCVGIPCDCPCLLSPPQPLEPEYQI